jgi:trigger factor
MATVTQQDVAPLHKQLNVTINKEDYLPTFEKALKDYSKKANIPGFRKGMVPAGLIRKMYGNSLFVDEVLKTVDREVIKYIETEKLDIFAQPLPMDLNVAQLDSSKPDNYTFTFEVGMKPDFALPDLASESLKRYKIAVTDDMVEEEVEKLRNRYGNMTEPEAVNGDENVLNVTFVETDAAGNEVEAGIRKDNSVLVKYFNEGFRQNVLGKKTGDELNVQLSDFEEKERAAIANDLGLTDAEIGEKHFKLIITKVGLVEKRELNEEFFTQLFPGGEVKTEEEFRNKLREDIQAQWDAESRNQLHHQLYHVLLNHTQIDFPAEFLKRWIKTQAKEGEQKTDEQVEQEFPQFLDQLKWSLVTEKIAGENNLQVNQDEIRQFAKQQLLGYMGGMGAMDEEQQWIRDYIDRMMKDQKYVEDAYHRIQTQKIFEFTESQTAPVEIAISKEEFIAMNAEHQHEHHEH